MYSMNTKFIYNIIAKVYDLLDVVYFRKEKSSPRKAIINLLHDSNIKVLDICTGTASNAVAIAQNKKNCRIYGVDRSSKMLQIARTKIKRQGLNNIKVFQMDATKMNYEEEKFDVALLSLVLHETPTTLARDIILEAKRVLKKEGRLIVMEWEQPNSFWKSLKFLPIRCMEPKGFNEFLKMDMKKYFEQFGLEVKQIVHCDYSKVLVLEKIIV